MLAAAFWRQPVPLGEPPTLLANLCSRDRCSSMPERCCSPKALPSTQGFFQLQFLIDAQCIISLIFTGAQRKATCCLNKRIREREQGLGLTVCTSPIPAHVDVPSVQTWAAHQHLMCWHRLQSGQPPANAAVDPQEPACQALWAVHRNHLALAGTAAFCSSKVMCWNTVILLID